MLGIIWNFLKAIFITFLGGFFSSILLIGFNFSRSPIETFLTVFWPTAMFCALLGFVGSYTVFTYKKPPIIKYKERLGAMRGFWMALSIILFAMTIKGTYEYIVSPLRINAKISDIKIEKNIKQQQLCPNKECGLNYSRTIPSNNKNW